MDSFDEGDQLDNLWINTWEDDTIDQYVSDLDKNINEHIQFEKEQCNQKLFQSFQTSACAVAQMFKDKTQSVSPWSSFQDAAGSITVLYKDSLDSCKLNFDLGVNIGQQRKIKELLNWLRKKKRRTIRKDELISFLVGKQAPNNTRLMNSRNNNRNNNNNSNNNDLYRQQLSRCNQNVDLNNGIASTHSDLATFREALIMHNRTRDTRDAFNFCHTTPNTNFATTSGSIANNNNNNNNIIFPIQQQQFSTTNMFSTPLPNHNNNNNNNININHQQQNNNNNNNNTDDLDCFFCEQVATHIDHKRSANNADLDSPTRSKRSRFY